MDQPRVVAKHRLLVDQVYVCDVHSWNDSNDVQHGVSGKLEVTSRRYTPKGTIVDLPRFRLTLSSKADASGELGRFLDRLRSSRQAAVVVLNKRGWVGYLLPHATDAKLYCHFHWQEHMDAARQQIRSQQPARMLRLAPIERGPWASRRTATRRHLDGLDGPDYDPALIYTMDELDPYRDMPMSSNEDLALDAPEYSIETSGMNGSLRGQQADVPPVRTDNGLGYGGQAGHSRAGRREDAPLSAQAEAAAKYGEELRTEAQQASSFIYHLKRFNNWVKATLISKASKDTASAGLRVLDLACGKGGDLGKWAAHPDGVEKYVGSDIAFGSLEHLVERMAKSVEKGGRVNWRKVPVKLFEADLGRNDVQRDHVRVWENMGEQPGEWDNRIPLNEGDLFDVASMQFALHYMGQTEGRMRRFLHEVSRHLRVGGIFIATTMDSRVLIQLLMGSSEQSWDSSLGRATRKVEIEDERKNNLLSIMFKHPYESYLRQFSDDGDARGPFGLEYTFTLRETELNKNAVDEVPEWMLPLGALKEAAADYGLDLETAQNFHDFYAQESQADPARLNLRNMHVFNPQGSMNSTEWRIAGIYMALVFRKTSTDMQPVGVSTPPSPARSPPRQHAPVSPTAPPPGWEGPPPKFQPSSPDHPPPQTKSPPPADDSDEDDLYDKAMERARSAVRPDEWNALSSEKKKACIDEQMRLLA
eukprot:g16087.t1